MLVVSENNETWWRQVHHRVELSQFCSLLLNNVVSILFFLSRRENPHDAVVFHPKSCGKTLNALPDKR